MKKNDVFTFTAPNGVEVTAIVIDKVGYDVHIRTATTTYLCYTQNRLFTYMEKRDIYTDEVAKEYGKVLVDYAILPDYDRMLEDYQHQIDMDDKIDSYLRGQMTKEEESQFISDCENNRELKERAYITALLAKSLKDK